MARTDQDGRLMWPHFMTPFLELAFLEEPILWSITRGSEQSTGESSGPQIDSSLASKACQQIVVREEIRHAFYRDPSFLDTMALSWRAGRLPSHYYLRLGPHETRSRCVFRLYLGQEVRTSNSNHGAAHCHATADKANACSTILLSQHPQAQPIINSKGPASTSQPQPDGPLGATAAA